MAFAYHMIMDVDPANVERPRAATAVAQNSPTNAKGGDAASILHDIFRQHALDETHISLGAPIKPVGVATSAITAFFLTVLIAVVLFLVNAKYARTETVTGQVTPIEGAFRIAAQIAGRLTAFWFVRGSLSKPATN
jgi:hypothetical protein